MVGSLKTVARDLLKSEVRLVKFGSQLADEYNFAKEMGMLITTYGQPSLYIREPYKQLRGYEVSETGNRIYH
jgi:hypothetical protein